MKCGLLGFIGGGSLAGLAGYSTASLILFFEWLSVEHLEFHLAFWCAMHGSVLGASIGVFGWRRTIIDEAKALCGDASNDSSPNDAH
jgi:uncharacterized membrane protein